MLTPIYNQNINTFIGITNLHTDSVSKITIKTHKDEKMAKDIHLLRIALLELNEA